MPTTTAVRGSSNTAAAARVGRDSVPGLLRHLRVVLPEGTFEYTVRAVLGRGATSFVYDCVENRVEAAPAPDATVSAGHAATSRYDDGAGESGDHASTADDGGAPAAPRGGDSSSTILVGGSRAGDASSSSAMELAGSATTLRSNTTNALRAATEAQSRTVALKVLLPHHSSPSLIPAPGGHPPSTAAAERRMRSSDGGEVTELDGSCLEARILASLRHPLVLRHVRHFVHEGCDYIVSELLDGGSLFDAMRSDASTRNGFPEATAAQYVSQIVRAVHYLHANGVVHRDLKAGNVLLTHDRATAKLCDFGLARRFDPSDAARAASWKRPEHPAGMSSAAVEGSAFWLAPEAILSGLALPCVDVWAIGCTAFELLSGAPPFFARSSTPSSALWHVAQLETDPAELWRQTAWSPEAQSFIAACLRLHPGDRPSCAELLRHPWLVGTAAPPAFGSAVPSAAAVASPIQPVPVPTMPERLTQEPTGGGGGTAAASLDVSHSETFDPYSGAGTAAASTPVAPRPPGAETMPDRALSPAAAASGTPLLRTDSVPDARGIAAAASRSGATVGTSSLGGHADLRSHTRTAHRNIVLGTLDAFCDPKNPAAVSQWLLGTEAPDEDVMNDSQAAGGGVASGTVSALAPSHSGSLMMTTLSALSVGSPVSDAKRRKARENVTLVIAEVLTAVAAWRAHNQQQHRQQPGAGPAAGGSSADADREGARAAAATIVTRLGDMAAAWVPHASAVSERHYQQHRGGVAPMDSVGALPPPSHPDDMPESCLAAYEGELLASHPMESADRGLALTWLLLDALSHTSFWTAAGDIRELYATAASRQRLAGHTPTATPTRAGGRARPGGDGVFSPAAGTEPPDESESSLMLFGSSTTSSVTEDTGGVPSLLSAHAASSPEDRVYDGAVAAVRHIVLLSLAAAGVPSASACGLHVATAVVQSPWALPLLLAQPNSSGGRHHRAEVLAALNLALDIDRVRNGQGTLKEGVCATALGLLGPQFTPLAAYAAAVPASVSRDGPLGATDRPHGVVSSGYIPARAAGLAGAGGEPSTATSFAVANTAPANDLSDVRGWLAAQVNPDLLPDIVAVAQPKVSRTPAEQAHAYGVLAAVLAASGKDRLAEVFGAWGAATLIAAASRGGSGGGGTSADGPPAAAGAMRSPQGSASEREPAQLVLLVLALLDGEWALRTFTMDTYLNVAVDSVASPALRYSFVAALLKLSASLPVTAFSTHHTQHGAGAGDIGRATRRAVALPSRLAVLLDIHPPGPSDPDPAVATFLQLALQCPEYARDLGSDMTFFRGVVAHVKDSRSVPARERGLELVRTLFEHSPDPTRFADDPALCSALVGIAQDGRSSKVLVLAACELLNAFANIAVF